LKGVPTVIATRGHEGSTVVARGNPALATGGSGDLLSGFIGSFLARGLATDEAAALGAYVLGRGAEIASESRTVRSTRPADVLDALPRLWAALRFPNPVHPPILLELDPPAVQ
jgi:NAD(P)H-hydrate repair Nnr-like enzyme with NAD(P)H-hydrate dehydratase domain